MTNFDITIVTSESTSDLTSGDLFVSNGTVQSFAGSGTNYSATISPTSYGTVTLGMNPNVFTDAAGNGNLSPGYTYVTYDQLSSTPVFSGPSSPNGDDSFYVDIVFKEMFTNANESVTGFTIGDITATNAGLSDFSGSGAEYSVLVTPVADGSVTLDIEAAAAQDAAGNDSQAATEYSITWDNTDPVLEIGLPAGPVNAAFTADFEFSERVTDFTIDDITVANGTASNFSGALDDYAATITPTGNGTVTVSVASGGGLDLAGNPNAAVSEEVLADLDGPSLTIGAPSTPQNGPFTATFSFSEDVIDFTQYDIAVNIGYITDFAGSGDSYSATVNPHNYVTDDTLTIDVSADRLTDAAGNGNSAAPQASVVIDKTAPQPSFDGPSSTVSGTFSLAISFSESVTGFTSGDLEVSNGSVILFTGTGDSYSASISPADDGIVEVSLPADSVIDSAGNGNQSSFFYVSADLTPPEVSISGPSAPQNGAFTVEITFTEEVTDFTLGDIVVGNGTASDLNLNDDRGPPSPEHEMIIAGHGMPHALASGSGYSATITPSAGGMVTVDIPSAAVQDSAGNDNTAAPQFSVLADLAVPTVTGLEVSDTDIRVDDIGNTFTITVTFSEAMDTAMIPNITFGAANVSTLNDALVFQSDAFSNGDTVYTANYTITDQPANSPTVNVTVADAADAAGNTIASTDFNNAFSAELRRGTLSIVQTIEGLTDSTFDFSGDLGAFTVTTTSQTGNRSFTSLDEGTYVLTQAAEDGFSLDSVTCNTSPASGSAATGQLTVDIAPGQATTCTFASTADPAIEEDSIPQVELNLPNTISNPSDVSATFPLTNQGGDILYFTASTNAAWLDITPESGQIPASGSADFTIRLNGNVNSLPPGTHTATITITTSAAPAPSGLSPAAAPAAEVVSFDITLELAARYGNFTLVTTTSPSIAGDADFTYASSIDAIDGITLSTSNGTASSGPHELLQDSYTITQNLPEGWRLSGISCTGDIDSGSVVDVEAGILTLDIDADEIITCTFANMHDEDYVVEVTASAISSFMAGRADRILTSTPDLTSRIRDGRGTANRNGVSADVTDTQRRVQFAMSLADSAGIFDIGGTLRDEAESEDPAAAGGDKGLDVWLQFDYSSVEDDRAGLDADTSFAIAHLGADAFVNPDLLVGAMVSIDYASTTTGPLNSEVEGVGFLAGPYVAARLRDNLYLDARAAWGRSWNEIDPLGLYRDDFETSRWLIEGHLTGDFRNGALRVSPQVGLQYFREHQYSYVDSLSFTIPSQNLTIGRLTAGPEVAYRFTGDHGGYLEPYARFIASWDFEAAEVRDGSGNVREVSNGVRADGALGLTAGLPNGASLDAEFKIDGLEDRDYTAYGGSLRLRMPFGPP